MLEKKMNLALLILLMIGGCKMTEAPSTAATTEINDSTMKAIMEHIKDKFSLSESDVIVKKLTSENLPSNVEQFYVGRKGGNGGTSYNYLVFDKELFCSGIEGDFEKFLQAYGFLQKKDMSEVQLLKVFRVLQLRSRDLLIVEKESLKQDKLKPYLKQLSEAKLSYSNDGAAILTFFTHRITTAPVEKWTVSIAPDYKISVTNTPLV